MSSAEFSARATRLDEPEQSVKPPAPGICGVLWFSGGLLMFFGLAALLMALTGEASGLIAAAWLAPAGLIFAAAGSVIYRLEWIRFILNGRR